MDNPSTQTPQMSKKEKKQQNIIAKIKEIPCPSLKFKSLFLSSMLKDIEKLDLEIKEKDFEDSKERSLKVKEILDKISEIIKGKSVEISLEEAEKYNITCQENGADKPIEYFWRISLVNSDFFEINDLDKEILNHLIDVRLIESPTHFPDFTIEFKFEDNEYLTNKVLTKSYKFEDKDSTNVIESNGCEIEWKDNSKDPTKKITKKKVKKGKVIEMKTIEKKRNSFFNIFNKKKSKPLESEEANFIRNDFILNSLEYYLGILEIKQEDSDEEEN